MIVFEHWFTYTTPLNFTRFKGIIKAFSGMCVRLTSITFPVIWSSVLISVTREWRYCGLVYKFFLINNIELKCSFVRCRKYHKSWCNGAAELHNLVDLPCGTTAAELHNSVDLLCDTTCAELHNSVDLLCDTTAAELHNSVDLLCGTTAAETFERWTFWKIQQTQIDSRPSPNSWCTLYGDSANF